MRDDGQIQAVVGRLSGIAFVAQAAVDRIAQAVQAVAELEHLRQSDDPDERERLRQANIHAEIAADQAQTVLNELVPRAATELFDTLGASATSRGKDLDRHWRNSRTVASHNPTLYKHRTIGAWLLNRQEPEYLWTIGVSRPGSDAHSSPTDPDKE